MEKQAVKEVFKGFGRHISQGQIRYLRAGHLDILEGKRQGAGFREGCSGRDFFDAFSSAGCFNVGRGNPEITGALIRAAGQRDMGSAGLLSEAKINCATALARVSPEGLDRVIFAGSGADGIECALKLARGATGRKEIISMDKAYHGHAGFSLSANGKPYYKELFEPLMPEFSLMPFGDEACLEKRITEKTAAVILEPIQGEGGIHVARDSYLKALKKICREKGAMLIFDEIQTGFCRTGKFWGSQHSGVVPDMMVAAKSMGGGVFPNGAVIYRGKGLLGAFVEQHPDFHPSFGGSDLGCITTLAVIRYLEEKNIHGNAREQGNRFMEGLKALQTRHSGIIKEVRGRGLMVGIEYVDEFMGVLMADCLAKQNIFAAYSGNAPQVMRFQVPLTITAQEVDALLAGIGKAVKEMNGYLLILRPLSRLPYGKWLLNEKDVLIPLNIFLRRFGL